MSGIQKTLDALQPYVIGIRYHDSVPLVDVIFKEGWVLPESSTVKKAKGDEGMNYYMVFSDVDNVGLDDLLAYVEKTIKLNLEREKKHELLKVKVNELKELFKKTTLSQLSRLRFTIGDEELVPDLNDFDEESIEPLKNEAKLTDDNNTLPETPIQYLDENKQPIELTDEEREIIEEEARASRNIKMLSDKKQVTKNKPNTIVANKIELPPKKKLVSTIDSNCECGEGEACSLCIDKQ